MNAFFKSQFNYCPLIWRFYSHEKKKILTKRLIYNDTQPSLNAFLQKIGSVSIHETNINFLVKEIYKYSKIFNLKDKLHPNLRYKSLFSRPLFKSVYNGIETFIVYSTKNIYGYFTKGILPDTYKDIADLGSFKVVLRK